MTIIGMNILKLYYKPCNKFIDKLVITLSVFGAKLFSRGTAKELLL